MSPIWKMTKREAESSNVIFWLIAIFIILLILIATNKKILKWFKQPQQTEIKQAPSRLAGADLNGSLCPAVRKSLGLFRVDTLLDAIEFVESQGNTKAIGDNGQAVGCMQIHPIMIKDVNRILKQEKFTLNDRYDRDRSRWICKVYMKHYCKDMNYEDAAACWVAGPDGYLQKDESAVKNYLEKINKYLANL